MNRFGQAAFAGAIAACVAGAALAHPASSHKHARRASHHHAALASQHVQEDNTGRKQRGPASYYSRRFAGRQTASGAPFNPNANIAASKQLPLGTTARVTNLHNGRSAHVVVADRGPYARNRIMDVSPKVADDLGMKKEGTTPVEVAPIEVPQPDGSVKPGEGAR
jgi:rare lipoprotein A